MRIWIKVEFSFHVYRQSQLILPFKMMQTKEEGQYGFHQDVSNIYPRSIHFIKINNFSYIAGKIYKTEL